MRSKLYNCLTKYPCTTYEEVKFGSLTQMRVEEDDVILNTIWTRHVSHGPIDRRTFTPKKHNWRPHTKLGT